MRRAYLLAVVATALAVMLGVASAAAQSVRGQVLDDSMGTAVAGARVELLDLTGHTVQQTSTAQDGTFRLAAPRPGPYRLNVRRLGYAPRMTPPLDLTLSDTLTVAVRLRTAAVSLAPVIVVGHGTVTTFNPLLESKGYYDREAQYGREGSGFGTFLDGDKLWPGASRVVDLLKDVPGIRIAHAGGTKAYVAGRGGCPPDIFVNGTFIGRSGSRGAEEALPLASSVAGIEVYAGGVAPAEYLRFGSSGCGVIVLWIGIRS